MVSYTGTYTLLNAGKIIGGLNSIERIKEVIDEQAVTKALIITDQGIWNAGLIEKPKNILESIGVQVTVIHSTPPEPEVEQVNETCKSQDQSTSNCHGTSTNKAQVQSTGNCHGN